MATKPTINKIWAEGTTNKYVLSEEAINTGISLKGDVVSNQLNSIANRTDEFIDNLQRVTAWNVGKVYNYGDRVCVLVNFKQLDTDKGNIYNLEVQCNNADGTQNEPMLKNEAIIFERNDDYAIPLYTIVANDSTKYIKDFINTDWSYCVNSDYLELKDEIAKAKKETETIISGLKKVISLEVKDHVISTAFVGGKYVVDLEAIVEAYSEYKKGSFEIVQCTFVPNLISGYAASGRTSVNLNYGNMGNFPLGTLSSVFQYSHTDATPFYYNMGSWSSDSSAATATAAAAYAASATAAAATAYASAATATATATTAYANASATANGVYVGVARCQGKSECWICIIPQVWDSSLTYKLFELYNQPALTLFRGQKLVIRNIELNCQRRTMGGTFYFQLEV